MDTRPLFASTRKKSRVAPWLRVSALILGVGSLGIVIAKITIPTDSALDQSVDLSIAEAIAPTTSALPEPSDIPQSTASLLKDDPLSDQSLTLTQPDTPPAAPEPVATTIKVKSGDSLSTIFSRLGLNYQTVSDVIAVGDQAAPLKNLRPGDQLDVEMTPDNQLLS